MLKKLGRESETMMTNEIRSTTYQMMLALGVGLFALTLLGIVGWA